MGSLSEIPGGRRETAEVCCGVDRAGRTEKRMQGSPSPKTPDHCDGSRHDAGAV